MKKSKKAKKSKVSTKARKRILVPRSARVIAPTVDERNIGLKTLVMLNQDGNFSKDESKVFNSFLDRFASSNMEKEDMYKFLVENPSIRRKIWEKDLSEF
ncbi:hypothetical protein HZC08_02270 [Candidatus Micrarchaeota archaeon]|nr:hypothetical protein [Candidatus Micrarchaeota archaeon]